MPVWNNVLLFCLVDNFNYLHPSPLFSLHRAFIWNSYKAPLQLKQIGTMTQYINNFPNHCLRILGTWQTQINNNNQMSFEEGLTWNIKSCIHTELSQKFRSDLIFSNENQRLIMCTSCLITKVVICNTTKSWRLPSYSIFCADYSLKKRNVTIC